MSPSLVEDRVTLLSYDEEDEDEADDDDDDGGESEDKERICMLDIFTNTTPPGTPVHHPVEVAVVEDVLADWLIVEFELFEED